MHDIHASLKVDILDELTIKEKIKLHEIINQEEEKRRRNDEKRERKL